MFTETFSIAFLIPNTVISIRNAYKKVPVTGFCKIIFVVKEALMWQSLEDRGFPNYEVSSEGEVRNKTTGIVLRPSFNQYGVLKIGLMHEERREQVTMSVANLVAGAFVDGAWPGSQVINLDADRSNNHFANLAWRPAWFAKMYHRQFMIRPFPRVQVPIMDVETMIVYENSWHACMSCGLLDRDVVKSVVEGVSCFPTQQTFVLFRGD